MPMPQGKTWIKGIAWRQGCSSGLPPATQDSGGSLEALRAAEGAGGGAGGRSPLPWRRHTELCSESVRGSGLVRAIMERFKGSSIQTQPNLPLPTPHPCPKYPEEGAEGSRERRSRQRMLTALMSWRAGSSSISRCMALDI